ncbi:hypothetical protein ATANTOWER_018373 [Ataeniobius toweri]|uniref:Uncharacterized protein n=1 Tax=Ataeniobius toweri TaxID=208326 RepID=A0ABU7C8G2_9TELE|nr:hypothetical protein [Ataeniobius toweri]
MPDYQPPEALNPWTLKVFWSEHISSLCFSILHAKHQNLDNSMEEPPACDVNRSSFTHELLCPHSKFNVHKCIMVYLHTGSVSMGFGFSDHEQSMHKYICYK